MPECCVVVGEAVCIYPVTESVAVESAGPEMFVGRTAEKTVFTRSFRGLVVIVMNDAHPGIIQCCRTFHSAERHETVTVITVCIDEQKQLFNISLAGSHSAVFPGVIQGRQQHPRENCNDSDNDEQFNQREAPELHACVQA